MSISSPYDSDGDGYIYVRGAINITGTAAGTDSLIYYLNYSLDGVNWTNIANSSTTVNNNTLGTLDTTGLSEVNYTLLLIAFNETANNSVNITITVDNTAPTILTGPSSSVTSNSATIIWTTNESSNATVQYGSTTSYGSSVSGSSSTYQTSHNETVTGLSASTTYHYRVLSYDKAGNHVNSSDSTFTTSASSSGDTGESGTSGGPVLVASDLVADPGGPYTGYVNQAITFDGSSSSTSEDQTITGYKWDFEYDGTYDTEYLTSSTTTHTYTKAGEYTVKLRVLDSLNRAAIATTTATVSEAPIDDDSPVISNIYHQPSKVSKSDTVTIYATVTDDYGIASVNLYWNAGSDQTTSMTLTTGNVYSASIGPFSEGTTVTYSIDAIDTASQTTQSSVSSFSISVNIKVVQLENVSSGESQEISSDDLEGTGLDAVEFTSTEDLDNVKMTIEKLENKPDEIISDPSSTEIKEIKSNKVDEIYVYSYLEIDLTSDGEAIEEGVVDIKIDFKIEKSWLDTNNIDKDSVILLRFKNNEWHELETSVKSEDNTYVYFNAISPGTSTFAIVGGTILSEPEVAPPAIPWFIIIIGIIAAVIVGVLLLFRSGFLYIEKEEK